MVLRQTFNRTYSRSEFLWSYVIVDFLLYVRSYAEFMNISKEVSTLENDLLELKENLAEWRSMPSVLHIEESTNLAGKSSHQP